MPITNSGRTFVQGESIEIFITVERETSVAGWTSLLTICKTKGSDPIASINGSVYDATGCILSFVIPAAQTALFPAGNYRFDAWRMDTGNEAQLSDGEIVVKSSTRAVS